jgi:zinc transporter ZupT
MLIARKVALSLITLAVAFFTLMIIAYSFGLGSTVQNIVAGVDMLLALGSLYFTWRGRWMLALGGTSIILIVGIAILYFLS